MDMAAPFPPPYQPPPQAQPPMGKSLSTAALAAVAILAFFIIGLIYVYIFVFSGMDIVSAYWWSGFVGFIFAFIFYLVHAAVEEPVTRIISGTFFALGAMFFYAAIGFGSGDPNSKILWLIVLSVIVLVVLLFVWRLTSQGAADDQRRAMRKRTP